MSPTVWTINEFICMQNLAAPRAVVLQVSMTLPRFLQIRLGNESCDEISASSNRPKPAKSRDKTAGSLFTRVYTLVEFSQTKRCFFSFLKQNIQIQMIHQHHYRLDNTIHISLKVR